ncbi:MAG TPA: hypothetical protein VFS22_04755 [Flavisolibacter sp.]|nr:hypothetical protein [Flavisolibacter sp.]
MEENHGHWRIVSAPQPPQWILELESRLRQVINDEQVLYAIKAERQSARLQNPA